MSVGKVVALGLVVAFVLSCGEHSWDDKSNDSSSSVAGGSSSSSGGGDSSSSSSSNSSSSYSSSSADSISSDSGGSDNAPIACPDAETDADNETVSCGGKTYKTVVIDSQTWMAENLNYAAEGSKCGGDDWAVSDEDTEYCNEYGRLYSWATAQGVCPDGWHIPSKAEWDYLRQFVGEDRYLKAKESWYDCGPEGSGTSKVCDDSYGFSALQGGQVGSEGYNGAYAVWWSSSEYDEDSAYGMMLNDDDEVPDYHNSKGYLYSVRCLKN